MKLASLITTTLLCGVCGWRMAKTKNFSFLVLVILISLVNVCIQRISKRLDLLRNGADGA